MGESVSCLLNREYNEAAFESGAENLKRIEMNKEVTVLLVKIQYFLKNVF